MKRIAVVLAVLAVILAAGAATLPAQPGRPSPTTRSAPPAQQGEQAHEEALLGFDPIELIGGSETLGNAQITATYGGLDYLFVSEANRELFLSDPDRYGVQMGNLCARLGRTTGGDQDLYSVFEGRIYVFASEACVEIFAAAPHRFLPPPPEPPLRETSTPEALARGRELIALAADALGGDEVIDAVDNLVEELAVQRPASGTLTESARTITLDFVHQRMRREQPLAAGSYVQVWSHEASWWKRADFSGSYSAAQAENLAKELTMPNLLYILRARDNADFVAASHGTGSADVLEHVVVQSGDMRWTLGIEPITGMLASITFVDRGPEGNWGEITHFLTDYRVVDGINWPHQRVVTFDGEMVPWWNLRTREVQVNVDLDGDLFTRPAGGGSA